MGSFIQAEMACGVAGRWAFAWWAVATVLASDDWAEEHNLSVQLPGSTSVCLSLTAARPLPIDSTRLLKAAVKSPGSNGTIALLAGLGLDNNRAEWKASECSLKHEVYNETAEVPCIGSVLLKVSSGKPNGITAAQAEKLTTGLLSPEKTPRKTVHAEFNIHLAMPQSAEVTQTKGKMCVEASVPDYVQPTPAELKQALDGQLAELYSSLNGIQITPTAGSKLADGQCNKNENPFLQSSLSFSGMFPVVGLVSVDSYLANGGSVAEKEWSKVMHESLDEEWIER